MSKVSDAKLADGTAEPELVKESSKEEEDDDDELRHLHDIEHLGEDIKNKISSAGLSGPTLVDDLFRSFLAKKMEDVESEHKKRKKKSSKEKREDEDGAKSRKHKKKHKKKHKSKSSHKRSRSRVSSDCVDQNLKLDQRSESNHCDSNIGSDTGHTSVEGVGHEQKSVTVNKSDANNLGASLGAEITDSNRMVYRKIESTVDATDATQHGIDAETEEEKGVIAKHSFDDFKDDEERVCKNVSNANCNHHDVNSLPSQMSHSKIIKHSCVEKESHDTCDNAVGRPGDLEAESIRRVLEPDEEHCNSPDFGQDQVHSVEVVRNETETTDCGKESDDHRNRTVDDGNRTADHENRTEDRGLRTVDHGDRTEDHVNGIKDHEERAEDHGNSTEDHGNDFKASDSKPLSTQLSGNISRAKSKEDTDFVSQSKDHSRKSKDLSKHSGSRTKDHSGRQSDKAAKGKSSSERKRHRSKSVDCDKKSKDHGSDSRDHGSQSKDHGCQMKDHGIQSKDHDRSSRDHGSSSKDHENRSRNHDDKSKDHGNHSKDNERRSRDHDSQSNDCPQHSTDRDNQQSADKTDSGDPNSKPQDRRQKSTERDGRSKDREQQLKEHDGHLKDRGQQSTERDSHSKDRGHRSIASDTRSKNCKTRSSEKDVDKSEKKRDRSRSSDHRHKSRERDRRSKDCRRQSKDRFAHGSEVDRDHSRSNRSDRKKDRSGSVEFRRRSKDRSKSVDRQKRRSREKSISIVDSDDDSHRPRRLKSKKQKHKKRRERSVEIIEDDDMESPEASEKLTERLLKRLNTSIKRGQELKEEKDALLDPKMSLGIEVVDLEESDCEEEERAKERAGNLEGTVVSTSGIVCERLSGVDALNVDVSSVAVASTNVSGGNCLSVSSIDVPAPVQGPDAETGSRMEKAPAVLASTTKPSLGKTKKPLMKMGIRLTESSMAIISSGVMAEPEQKVKAEDEGGDSTARTCGSEDQPLAGDVPPRDSPFDSLPKQLDKNLSAEANAKPGGDESAATEDGLAKRDPDRASDQRETTLKSESRKRRRSRSKDRGMKKSKDNRSRDMAPTKNSDSKTKDVDRRLRSHSRSRKSRSRSKKRRRKSRSRSNDRHRKSRSRSKDRRRKSRSRSGERRHVSRSQSKDRRLGRRHGRSRSPAPEKPHVDLRLKIDKARLREIAIKKVYGNAMQKGGIGPVFDMKPDEVVAFKSGGKSVEELTDFCKRIAAKEKNQLTESPSPEEERPVSDDDEDMPFTANAFKAKELTNSIVLNIRNSRPLPVLSSQEKIAKAAELRTQFPVSSGTQHRAKEWVPVEKTQPGVPGSSTGTAPLPGSVEPAVVEDKVFPDPPAQQIDVGQVVSERLSALRKLQSNPNDVQALGNVFKSQQRMQQWAASKQLPGQFLGSTGLNVLPQKDIFNHNPRNQAWVKKVCAQGKVSGGGLRAPTWSSPQVPFTRRDRVICGCVLGCLL